MHDLERKIVVTQQRNGAVCPKTWPDDDGEMIPVYFSYSIGVETFRADGGTRRLVLFGRV